MKHILAFLLIGFITFTSSSTTVQIEDDVFVGGQLPQWGYICTKTDVYGNPYELPSSKPLYFVEIGEKVRLHELAPGGQSWVMIGVAEWIPIKALCEW